VQFVIVKMICQPAAIGWSNFGLVPTLQSSSILTVGTAWLGVANRTELAASATAARILDVFFIYKLLLSFSTTKSQLFETRIVFGSSPLNCQPLATT
jgi:hypothetical protein